jgi:hypothetical protein
MATMLFELTTDAQGQDSLIETAHLHSVEGLDLSKARTEIMFLNLSAIYVAAFRFADPRELHRDKLDEMYLRYLALFKRKMQPLGAEREEEFLQVLEVRLTAYNKVYDLWRDAHEKGRAHEQSFVIGDAFFKLCGVRTSNPISLTLVQHHFLNTVTAVSKQLKTCTLKSSHLMAH